MTHWRRRFMCNSFQDRSCSWGDGWLLIFCWGETFATYRHLRPFWLLQALISQLPPPNPNPAHQTLLQLGYDYDHYSLPTVLSSPSWSAPSSKVIYQGTHRCSSHPSYRSGGIFPRLLRSLSFRYCCHCLSIFLLTTPCLARWSCWLLLLGTLTFVEESD